MGDKTITKELEELVPEFYKQVKKFVESIDNKASQKKVDEYINLYKDNLQSYSERISSSERRIRDRENILAGLKRDLDIINADLVKIEERESVLKDEFNSCREKLQNHLNNEIYMVFLNRPDYADVSKSEDDVYKKIIEELFTDFETKVKSNYTKRTSEVKDYMLVKDEKYEGKDDAMITHIRLVGFFKEEDMNVAGRIQYELGMGYKYKFKDKFVLGDIKLEEPPVSEGSPVYETEGSKKKSTLFWLLIVLGLAAAGAGYYVFKGKNNIKKAAAKEHFGNAFQIEGSSVVVVNGRKGANIKLGRKGNPENDISFKFPDISRKHLSVKIDDDILISDNSSSAGTYINGNKITPGNFEKLEDNSILQIADFVKFRHIKDGTGNSVLKIMPLTVEEKEQLDEEVVSDYPDSNAAIVILRNTFDLNTLISKQTKAVLGNNGISFNGSKVILEANEILL